MQKSFYRANIAGSDGSPNYTEADFKRLVSATFEDGIIIYPNQTFSELPFRVTIQAIAVDIYRISITAGSAIVNSQYYVSTSTIFFDVQTPTISDEWWQIVLRNNPTTGQTRMVRIVDPIAQYRPMGEQPDGSWMINICRGISPANGVPINDNSIRTWTGFVSSAEFDGIGAAGVTATSVKGIVQSGKVVWKITVDTPIATPITKTTRVMFSRPFAAKPVVTVGYKLNYRNTDDTIFIWNVDVNGFDIQINSFGDGIAVLEFPLEVTFIACGNLP